MFTIINRTSRWMEAVAVPLLKVETECMEALVTQWIVSLGSPATITSDQRAQLTSSLWGKTCRQVGIVHTTTTAYRLQSNGMVQRVHR